jgi:phage antirepressor YoqD-like protein
VNELQVIEHNGQRVLTTEQLAQAYGCETANIKKNFNSNKERFEEGKHFFKLEGEELQNLRVTNSDLQISPMARNLYLWTRRGASRHCKMLGTDRAWEMFDRLEETYFSKKEPPMLTMEEQMAQGLLAAQKILAEKDKQIEEMKPKAIFADAVSASKTSILVGDLAKLIRQNGVDVGQKRLFGWLRENGWLMKGGASKNMPTQRGMEMGLFEVKEGSYVNGEGVNVTTKTTKVTGKGQVYFVNKFLNKEAG